MTERKIQAVHPGEILLEEFLKPKNISQKQLALDIGVSSSHINEVVHGKCSVTADIALRLGRYFGMSAEFWINLQGHYDLEIQTEKLADRLEREVRVFASAQ